MTTQGERLAALEQKVEDIDERNESAHERVFETLNGHKADLKVIRTDVHAIRLTLEKYRGFWAGAMAAIGTLFAGIGAAWTWLWTRLTGGDS